jgi:hypothetical protein
VRLVLLAFCLLGVLATIAVQFHPLTGTVGPGLRGEVNGVVRLTATLVVSGALLYAPGWALRHRFGWFQHAAVAFLPLPGLLATSAGGTAIWAAAPTVDSRPAAATIACALLGGSALVLLRRTGSTVVSPPGRAGNLAALCLLLLVALAVGRSLWSLDVPGSLYEGTIWRTLEVGDRSDSRISFHLVQLIANGTAPHSDIGQANFLPWSISDRGPLAGLWSSVPVLASGTMPPMGLPDAAWSPFDAEGFAAYRMAMIVLASMVLVPAYGLLKGLRAERAGLLAVVLLATTPFVIHETYFTWPKLAAAAGVLMAAAAVERRAWFAAGLLAGLAYLCHPLGLLSLPTVAIWGLLRHRHLRSARPLIRPGGLAALGLAIPLVIWRLANAGHNAQGNFLGFATSADGAYGADAGTWLLSRAESLADTLLPFAIPLLSAHNRSVNAVGEYSPAVVHVFFGYWNALPFGVGLLAFPVVISLLWRFARQWPWYAWGLIVLPLLLFAAYWGATVTGLLREGMHPWVVSLVLILAWTLSVSRQRIRMPVRVLLALRPIEALAMMLVPVIATTGLTVDRDFRGTDLLAWVLMIGSTIGLAVVTWGVLAAQPTGLSDGRSPAA